ncbi:MAG: hypothetical protein A2007_05825 [Verrucomicrobia bacterium GWC2_42_7]|nr:MAG: hypothetical protein A2007_05825 [Verrucomicrobia bacterium GWC2_42_7]
MKSKSPKNCGETAFGPPKAFPRTPSEKDAIFATTSSLRTSYSARHNSAKASPKNIAWTIKGVTKINPFARKKKDSHTLLFNIQLTIKENDTVYASFNGYYYS